MARRSPAEAGEKGRMRVSAIIVNWNGGDLLRSCIAPPYRELGGPLVEMIVVDNASSDQSLERIQQAFPALDIVRLSENFGFAKATNLGILASRGEAVLMMNNDAVATPGAIASLVKVMEQDERIAIVGPQLRNADGSLQLSYGRFPSVSRVVGGFRIRKGDRYYERRGYEHLHDVDWLTGACLLVRRRMLDEIGLLDERFFFNYEDVDLCRRARDRGWRCVYTPDASVMHHRAMSSGNPQIKERILLEKRRSQLIYYRKHASIESFYLIKAINLAYGMLHLLWSVCATIANRGSSEQVPRPQFYRRLLTTIWATGWSS
jgi:GT2 family glycosyltransferase